MGTQKRSTMCDGTPTGMHRINFAKERPQEETDKMLREGTPNEPYTYTEEAGCNANYDADYVANMAPQGTHPSDLDGRNPYDPEKEKHRNFEYEFVREMLKWNDQPGTTVKVAAFSISEFKQAVLEEKYKR